MKSTTKFIFYSNTSIRFTEKISLSVFLKEVDKILNHIYEDIDSKEFEITENISLVDGVLNLKMKNKNYVLNIQRPNLQLWLSSPISGPQRFEYDPNKQRWFNIRNQKCLLTLLNEEINSILKENRIYDTLNLLH